MSERSAYGLGQHDLHEMYRALCLTRVAEERLEFLDKEGHVAGDLYRSLGQEAGAVGAAFALSRATDGTGDVLAPSLRAAGALFVFGGEVVDFFRQHLGRATGPTRGREANVNWFDFEKGFVGPVSPLGTMVEVMAGITLAFQMRSEDRVGMVFCGDGASSTGAWHEGLCLAAIKKCPMLLMVENNQWAYATPTRLNTRVSSFTEKGPGYGIGARSVDGTDVLAVFNAVREAAALARSGEGTQMIELRYFRRLGFTQHDDQDYVDPSLLSEWEAKDPIELFRMRLLLNEWASEDELAAIEGEVFEHCREAAEIALDEPVPGGPEAVTHVYSDASALPPWTRAAIPDPTLA